MNIEQTRTHGETNKVGAMTSYDCTELRSLSSLAPHLHMYSMYRSASERKCCSYCWCAAMGKCTAHGAIPCIECMEWSVNCQVNRSQGTAMKIEHRNEWRRNIHRHHIHIPWIEQMHQVTRQYLLKSAKIWKYWQKQNHLRRELKLRNWKIEKLKQFGLMTIWWPFDDNSIANVIKSRMKNSQFNSRSHNRW